MKACKSIAIIAAGILAGTFASAQGVNITQIDSDRLLSAQAVRLYVDPPADGSTGDGEMPEIEVWESADAKDFAQRPIRSISRKTNEDEGISFFFLLDNSGSMWDGLDGTKTQDAGALRITHAKEAARSFLGKVSPRDKVALAVFNTRYWKIQDAVSDVSGVSRGLDEIKKPVTDDAYTELYIAITKALGDFAGTPGRKALIVLSDGQNFPYFAKSGKPSPEFGERVAKPKDGIDAAIREGITCYVVRFGPSKDPDVDKVALGSGGSVFDARDREELSGIYDTIRANVLGEIAVDYRAGMDPGEVRYVKVVTRSKSGVVSEASRYYYSGTVLGWSREPPAWYYLPLFAVPLLVWLAFLMFKMERETTRAGLQQLYGPSGKQTQFFSINSNQTVIGGDDSADITIAGNPSLKGRHATIVFDKTKLAYTIVGDANLTVNNRSVSTKRLEPGDVINMAGTVVVFDDALVKDKRKPKK